MLKLDDETHKIVGPLKTDSATNEIWIGVEWDDFYKRGKHNGTVNGTSTNRLFYLFQALLTLNAQKTAAQWLDPKSSLLAFPF